MDWFFSGLGTMLLGLLIGAAGGGIAGFKIGIKKSVFRQSQVAGNSAQQTQIGNIAKMEKHDQSANFTSEKSVFNQEQRASDNAVQKQEGGA